MEGAGTLRPGPGRHRCEHWRPGSQATAFVQGNPGHVYLGKRKKNLSAGYKSQVQRVYNSYAAP